MAQFRPFRGLFYNEPGTIAEDGVMDVSSALGPEATSPYAASILAAEPELVDNWLASGHLLADSEPGVYMVRAGWRDAAGNPAQASGVFGLVDGKTDNLQHGLEVVKVFNNDFELLLQPVGMPLVTATTQGVHFRLWALHQLGVVQTIAEAVGELPADYSGLVYATVDSIVPPAGLLFAGPQSN